MKQKFYIHGSFMNDNYGDYLLFDIVYSYFLENNLEAFSSNVSITYDNYITLKRESKFYALKNSTAAVFCGGGYFGEPDVHKFYWNLRFLFKHGFFAFIYSMLKKPYVILGVGVGPLSFFLSRIIVKHIFKNAEIVSVRDFESKTFLENLGVNNVLVIPDWIMGMKVDKLIMKDNIIKEKLNVFTNKRKIVIHLTTKLNEDNKCGLQAVINELNEYLNSDMICIVICDQNNDTQVERSQIIMNKLKCDTKLLETYKGPWYLSSLINNADLVITDKLHVGIVATRLKKKVISVAAHSKTNRFYRTIGNNSCSIHLKKIKYGDFTQLLENVMNSDYNVDNVIKKAKKNQTLLDEFITRLIRSEVIK